MGYEAPIVPPPSDYKGEFFKGMDYNRESLKSTSVKRNL